MAYSYINQLINSRHWERILWASFVQIREVHTHSLLPVLLFHHHSIG